VLCRWLQAALPKRIAEYAKQQDRASAAAPSPVPRATGATGGAASAAEDDEPLEATALADALHRFVDGSAGHEGAQPRAGAAVSADGDRIAALLRAVLLRDEGAGSGDEADSGDDSELTWSEVGSDGGSDAPGSGDSVASVVRAGDAAAPVGGVVKRDHHSSVAERDVCTAASSRRTSDAADAYVHVAHVSARAPDRGHGDDPMATALQAGCADLGTSPRDADASPPGAPKNRTPRAAASDKDALGDESEAPRSGSAAFMREYMAELDAQVAAHSAGGERDRPVHVDLAAVQNMLRSVGASGGRGGAAGGLLGMLGIDVPLGIGTEDEAPR
jgi:hypothetical protein